MSLSLLARMEDEVESCQDDIYNQLKLLLQTPKKNLGDSIKKEIWNHLRNFNFGLTWIEDGHYLLMQARADKATRQSALEDQCDIPWFEGSYEDYQAEEHFEQQVALWESRLNAKIIINRDEDGLSRSKFHRTGIKRDKTEFWSRPSPTRWHKHHQTLRKLRQEKKAAKRQQARC